MIAKRIGALVFISLSLAVVLIGCGDDKTTAPADTKTYVHIPFPEGTYFDRVTSIEVTVTAADIATPLTVVDTSLESLSQLTLAITVPAGADRHFDILAADSSGHHLYRAQYDITVNNGTRTDLSAMMYPIGYGTPSRVKIFRNNLPWGFTSTDSVLINMGFTIGAGNNQYQILASSLMGSITLTPGTDLVILEADQDAAFYEDYMSSHDAFEEFVTQGGTLFFICALPNTADLVMPESVTYHMHVDSLNYTINNDHPITANLGESIEGDYASHGELVNLPDHALTLMINTVDSVTTAIYTSGKGTVILSTQTLEWLRRFRYSFPEGGSILSRIIHYALGHDPTPEPQPRVGQEPNIVRSKSTD
jgi:hypothetical protein